MADDRKFVELDSRNRVSLNKLPNLSKSYLATAHADGTIVLEPATAIPVALLDQLSKKLSPEVESA